MKTASKIAAAALFGFGAVALAGTAAKAAVVCNGDGYCWHTHEAYSYPNGVGVTIHEDNWRWSDSDHYAWHEHDGRGYWRGGAWVTF